MEFLELTQSRRSIRGFTGEDVPQEDVWKLLGAARSAPSGGNCQPWHFYVVRDKAVQADIAKAAGRNEAFLLTAPVLFVVCVEPSRSERYGERGKTLYCIQDTAAAIQNILLCAKDLGFGTCWCGAFDEDAVSRVLRLQGDKRPVAIIPVGVPANEPLVSVGRRPLEEIVTFIGERGGDAPHEESPRKVEHCDMSGTEFRDINLYGSVFSDANMQSVEITDVNFTDGSIHGCNLTGFAVYDCKIEGMTVNGKDIIELLEK